MPIYRSDFQIPIILKSLNFSMPKSVKNSPLMGWGGLSSNNVWKCQKDVICQRVKDTDKGRGFTKKLIDTMRFTHIDVNFDDKYEGIKNFQNTFYAHFEGFWLPSYVMSKMMSIYANLIMSIYFLWTFSIVHVLDFLTSFWQLDIFLTFWHMTYNRATWSTYVIMCRVMRSINNAY